MEINPLTVRPIGVEETVDRTQKPVKQAAESFSDIFEDTLAKVNTLQQNADSAVKQFVAGELDIHEVMIEVEKANTALQLAVQLRNKAVEAYQEIMRMQV